MTLESASGLLSKILFPVVLAQPLRTFMHSQTKNQIYIVAFYGITPRHKRGLVLSALSRNTPLSHQVRLPGPITL